MLSILRRVQRIQIQSLLALALFIVIGCSYGIQEMSCEVNEAEPREIVDTSIQLRHSWSRAFGVSFTANRPLITTNDLLVAAKYCDEIIALDLGTGDIDWRLSGLVNPTDLIFDSNHNVIYVSEQARLRAVSALSGEILWTNSSNLFERTAHPAYLTENGDLIVYPVGRGMYYVVPDTGSIQEQINVPERTVFYSSPIAFVKLPPTMEAINVETGDRLWRYENLSGSWEIIPFEHHNLLVVRWRYGNDMPSLTALDWNTGEIKWEHDEGTTISNVLMSDVALFVLTDSARLLILDAQSGNELGFVQFETPRNETAIYDSSSLIGSQIVVKEDTLAIYFQDTNILSTYEFDF